MYKTGVADLPLHGGKAPKWLFTRMVNLSESILDVMVREFCLDEVFYRLSDPFWFQSLSCILGYDWHSSGTTTVTCGALKEAIDGDRHGFFFVGGKGRTSRKTPREIETIANENHLRSDIMDELKYASKMTAKIDSAAIQDHHFLYHHSFFFSKEGKWGVIQQGMNEETRYARRYHWCSTDSSTFLMNPHSGIIGKQVLFPVLNMASDQSELNQHICIDLVNDHPRHLQRDWEVLRKPLNQTSLDDWDDGDTNIPVVSCLSMPRCLNWKRMHEIYEWQPRNYEEFLSLEGVGPSTVRALALISDLIYGEKPSWEDPVKYSYAHGGKDGVPYPVDTKGMDTTIQVIEQGIEEANLGRRDKLRALKQLKHIIQIDT